MELQNATETQEIQSKSAHTMV